VADQGAARRCRYRSAAPTVGRLLHGDGLPEPQRLPPSCPATPDALQPGPGRQRRRARALRRASDGMATPGAGGGRWTGGRARSRAAQPAAGPRSAGPRRHGSPRRCLVRWRGHTLWMASCRLGRRAVDGCRPEASPTTWFGGPRRGHTSADDEWLRLEELSGTLPGESRRVRLGRRRPSPLPRSPTPPGTRRPRMPPRRPPPSRHRHRWLRRSGSG
jgi:hypothetical protein